jgi:hypothetical protein
MIGNKRLENETSPRFTKCGLLVEENEMARVNDFDDEHSRRPRRSQDDRPRQTLRKQKSHLGLILGILGVTLLLCCGGGLVGGWYFTKSAGEKLRETSDKLVTQFHDEDTKPNLSKIGFAMYDSEAKQAGHFLCDTYGPDGKPLLSWRVHLLPDLGEEALYKQFKLDEPWDSLNNIQLLKKMPAVYATPDATRRVGEGRTYYRAMTGEGGSLQPFYAKQHPKAKQPLGQRLADFTAGASLVIMFFEASESISWTKPDELEWLQNQPKPKHLLEGGLRPQATYFWAVMMDGTPKKVKRRNTDEVLWRLFNRKGALDINTDWQGP